MAYLVDDVFCSSGLLPVKSAQWPTYESPPGSSLHDRFRKYLWPFLCGRSSRMLILYKKKKKKTGLYGTCSGAGSNCPFAVFLRGHAQVFVVRIWLLHCHSYNLRNNSLAERLGHYKREYLNISLTWVAIGPAHPIAIDDWEIVRNGKGEKLYKCVPIQHKEHPTGLKENNERMDMSRYPQRKLKML